DLIDGDGGLRIAFISDIHASSMDKAHLAYIVDEVNALEPDIVIIGGDTIESSPDEFPILEPLKGLKPRIGSFAVLGNHDYGEWGCGSERTVSDLTEGRLEELGISVLRNEHTLLSAGGRQIALIGVDDEWSCMNDYLSAGAGLDDSIPKIVVAHNQESVDGGEIRGMSLVLSGHTHCGQFRVPIITPFLMKHIGGFGGALGGRERLDDDTEAYVSCGITPGGIRFNAPPEISVIEIV
ncbi:MAG: metallophosphoesterase, partial [Candidatus Micrarchaeota archaeon]